MLRTAQFLSGLFVLALSNATAQGIDSVFTEVYHVQQDSAGGAPLITYRIFVDLAPGYELQMVYGDERNPLEIKTTTVFFNDLELGQRYGHQIDAARLNDHPLALDSWITINAVSRTQLGVPRAWDEDGSVLECPPYPGYGPDMPKGVRPLCASDGAVAADSVPEVVDFRFGTAYLGNVRGGVLYAADGAWAVLGGTPGVGKNNVCLIAQLSTTGALSYRLNVQVRTPDRKVVRYVHSNARGTEEVLAPGLVRQ